VNGVHAVHNRVVGEAQILVALHAAALQAAALVAVVPRGIVLAEVDAVVLAGDDWVHLADAEGAVVGTAVAGVVPIAELIAVAKSVYKIRFEFRSSFNIHDK